MLIREQGDAKGQNASDLVIYRIEVPANRWVWSKRIKAACWLSLILCLL